MDLTLTDAWALWWSGQQLTDHALHGAPVLWLGRAGKLLAFLAGTTIILDVIGPERLREFSERIARNTSSALLVVLRLQPWLLGGTMVVGIGLLWADPRITVLVFLIGGAITSLFTFLCLPETLRGIAAVISNPRAERWLRVIAVPLFFTGFALDYLAS